MKLTSERKAEQKVAARWCANVKRRLKESGAKMVDFGRAIAPDSPSPSSTAFNTLIRHTMPDSKTEGAVAAFLGVSKEALHQGELPEIKEKREERGERTEEGRGTRRVQSPESRVQNPELGKRTRKPRAPVAERAGRDTEEQRPAETGTKKLNEAVKQLVVTTTSRLIEGPRGDEFVARLAELCVEFA